MRRAFSITVSLLVVILILSFLMGSISGCKNTIPGQLDVYVWEGYLPEPVVDLFEQETGIKLNITFITDSEKMLTLLKGGGKADIIMPTDSKVNLFYQNNLVQALDMKKMTNYKNVAGTFTKQSWARWDGNQVGTGDVYAIPYVFGTSGLAINTSKYTKSLDGIGWDALFDADLKGRVSSKNNIFSVLLILDMLGIPRENLVTDTRDTLEQVRDKVTELKNNVLKFYDSYTEIIDLMKNEEVWVCQIADGNGRKLSKIDSKFKYVLPEEGGLGWADTFMISKSAANPAGANLLINFMLRPEIAAMVTDQSGFNTTVSGALDLTKNIDKQLFRYTDEDIENFKWSPGFSENVMSDFYSFWEEISTVK
jgi:spermidine/putrescine transport system substrate-binding protein